MNNKSDKNITEIKTLVWDIVDTLENYFVTDRAITGISSGFKELDKITDGFCNSNLIIIAGASGIGKTSFALNIASHIAVNNQIPMAFFSMKMTKEQVGFRLMSIFSGLSLNCLQSGKIGKDDWDKLGDAVKILEKGNLFVIDAPVMSISEISEKAITLKIKQDIQVLIIDYLQLIKRFDIHNSSEILKSLKNLAKELNIPIIVISKLDSSMELRLNKRPFLFDLRNTGVTEYYADIVFFIYRDEFYNETKKDEKGLTEIIIAKNKDKPTGCCKLYFNKETVTFLNYDDKSRFLENQDKEYNPFDFDDMD